jgi:hypothetical protein
LSGDRLIAQRIASSEEDNAVKRCLQALFTHELDNADSIMPRYKEEFEKVIERLAPSWASEAKGSGEPS